MGLPIPVGVSDAGILRRLCRTIADFCQVTQIDRPSIVNAHHQFLDVLYRLQKRVGKDFEIFVEAVDITGRNRRIGALKRSTDTGNGYIVPVHSLGFELNADLPGPPAGYVTPGDVFQPGDAPADLFSDPAQFMVV